TQVSAEFSPDLSLPPMTRSTGELGSSLSKKVMGTTTPNYTIPARATGFDAVALTALIGRVPVSGSVVDPFPVKLVLGQDNLAANGHHIPGLDGIILDGIAQGDWTLGCVSVKLTDRKSTRLNSSHVKISYAVFGLKKKIGDTCVFRSGNTATRTRPHLDVEQRSGVLSVVGGASRLANHGVRRGHGGTAPAEWGQTG